MVSSPSKLSSAAPGASFLESCASSCDYVGNVVARMFLSTVVTPLIISWNAAATLIWDAASFVVAVAVRVSNEVQATGLFLCLGSRSEAVLHAASDGRLGVVQSLLPDGATISKKDRGRAVWNAASYGHLKVVQFLLAGGAISERDRGWAVQNAASYGHLKVVQSLLADGATISDEDRGWAVQDAAEKGHLEIVQYLVSLESISAKDLGAAFHLAKESRNSAIAEFLNKSTSDEDREAFNNGAADMSKVLRREKARLLRKTE